MKIEPLKFILVLANFFILSFLLVLMIDHYNANNNISSYSSLFHFMTFSWLAIRGTFWLLTLTSTASWSAFQFYFLYWMPNPLEFGSFMLLPLFFAQIIYPHEWEKYWIHLRPLYIFAIVGLFVFQSVWAFISAYEKSIDCYHDNTQEICYRTSDSSDLFRLMTAISFITLATVQASYAYMLHYLDDKQYNRYMITSRPLIAVVNSILVFSFLSRGIYQLLTIFDILMLPNIPLQSGNDVDYRILVCFTLWDYIPVILIITTITSRSIGNIAYYANSIIFQSRQYSGTKRIKRGDHRNRSHAAGTAHRSDHSRARGRNSGGSLSHLPKVPLQIDIVKEECEGEVEDEEFIANEATSLLRSSYGSYTGDVSLIRPRIANTSPNRNPLTVSNSYNSRYSQNHLQSSPAKLKVNKGIPHFDWTTNRYDTASECGNSVDDDGSSIHSRSSSFNISSSSNVNGKSFSFNVAASNINTVVGPHSPTYGLSSSEINSNTNQNIGAFNTNNSNYRSGDDNDGDNFDDDYDYEVDPCSLDRFEAPSFSRFSTSVPHRGSSFEEFHVNQLIGHASIESQSPTAGKNKSISLIHPSHGAEEQLLLPYRRASSYNEKHARSSTASHRRGREGRGDSSTEIYNRREESAIAKDASISVGNVHIISAVATGTSTSTLSNMLNYYQQRRRRTGSMGSVDLNDSIHSDSSNNINHENNKSKIDSSRSDKNKFTEVSNSLLKDKDLIIDNRIGVKNEEDKEKKKFIRRPLLKPRAAMVDLATEVSVTPDKDQDQDKDKAIAETTFPD